MKTCPSIHVPASLFASTFSLHSFGHPKIELVMLMLKEKKGYFICRAQLWGRGMNCQRARPFGSVITMSRASSAQLW